MKKPAKSPRRAIVLGDKDLALMDSRETITIGPGFQATVNGLKVTGKPNFGEWQEAGKLLRILERGAQFAIGDFLLKVDALLGEEASQIVDYSEGWSEATCNNYRWVASRIAPQDRRMDRLGFKHHQMVAALSPAKQQHWLLKAAADTEDKPWTAARLRKAMDDGEDLPITAWYVLVRTSSESAQSVLIGELMSRGYQCEVTNKRRREKSSETAAA